MQRGKIVLDVMCCEDEFLGDGRDQTENSLMVPVISTSAFGFGSLGESRVGNTPIYIFLWHLCHCFWSQGG